MTSDFLHDAPAVVGKGDAPYADLYCERVLRARQMSGEAKALAGQRLFEAACEITLLGIRDQNPHLTDAECRRLLRERLAWRRRQEAMK